MRTIFVLLLSILFSLHVNAQTTDENQHRAWNDLFMHNTKDSIQADTLALAGEAVNHLSLPWNVPTLDIGAYGISGFSPYAYGSSWRLHNGFNAQFGLSMTAGLGKHSPKGVGFGQTAAFAYVAPLSKRLSVAAGITASNFDWGMWRSTNVGLGGVLTYQLTDRINLYAYGEKSFLPRNTIFQQMHKQPFPLFLAPPSSRIGAAAEFKIGNNAMIGISVERREY